MDGRRRARNMAAKKQDLKSQNWNLPKYGRVIKVGCKAWNNQEIEFREVNIGGTTMWARERDPRLYLLEELREQEPIQLKNEDCLHGSSCELGGKECSGFCDQFAPIPPMPETKPAARQKPLESVEEGMKRIQKTGRKTRIQLSKISSRYLSVNEVREMHGLESIILTPAFPGGGTPVLD
jgi:hypothetical protein